jgi:hypothetical protein
LIEKTGVNISHDTVPLITNDDILCVVAFARIKGGQSRR